MNAPKQQPVPLDLAQFEGHTPGPWETPGEDGGDRVICYRDRNGKRRTLAHVYSGGPDSTSMKPNADLVAAAPTLLAECKRQRAENKQLREALEAAADELKMARYFNAEKQARAALAKVKP